MNSEVTKGIIYRIIKYSDRSAICFGFTEQRGRLKFFVSNAFGKNRTIQKIFPAEITYIYKDNTDLHKITAIEYLTGYSFFQTETPLYLRLNLIFEIIEDLFPLGSNLDELWRYLMGLNRENYIKGVAYILFYILETAGIISRGECIFCGMEMEKYSFICERCEDLNVDDELKRFVKAFEDRGSFRKLLMKDDSYVINLLSDILKKHQIFPKSLELIKYLNI
ncbi:DNA repair protein RecO [Calditerrivibrio nitroreducens]|uniref:Uncharacterized protein n=1 Tax=Calditerrivibrio nitroreducens (strain DSM 19672 / NBRC 101217 / Yu37-1) TaxID=768670 RepID=E4TF22_CALNY|nr:recombination protein O N-terminal domain-containing protein [Calditerrivibrio nitroreducens]ADR19462.1 hypothetical protein Calni_1554 [Calditerrivibrio nitroreducens DSM 19672]